MTVQCCRCKKVRVHDHWVTPQVPLDGMISHSYCPSCLDQTRNELIIERCIRQATQDLPIASGQF